MGEQPRRDVHTVPVTEYDGFDATVLGQPPRNALVKLAKFQSVAGRFSRQNLELIPAKLPCKGVSPVTTLFSENGVQTFGRPLAKREDLFPKK